MPKGYKDYREWIQDVKNIKNDPSSAEAIKEAAVRLESSNSQVQEDITKSLIWGAMNRGDDEEALNLIQVIRPDSFLIIYSKEDPWFEV